MNTIAGQLRHDYPDTNKDVTRKRDDVQRTAQRRPDQAGVPVADGRGRLRAADRVRQRRQPAAGALGDTARARCRSASRSARRAGASSGSCWSRACCSRSSAVSSGWRSPTSASGCSTRRRRTSASRTGSSSRWTRSVFAFFAAVCLGTGIIFGLAPALHVSKTDLNEVLKEGGRSGSSGVRARRWTSVLIVAELALTLVLLAGAGFMMRSFLTLYRLDVGVDTAQLLTMRLALPDAEVSDARIAARVLSSGSTSGSPGSRGIQAGTITTQHAAGRRHPRGCWRSRAGRSRRASSRRPSRMLTIGPRYFETARPADRARPRLRRRSTARRATRPRSSTSDSRDAFRHARIRSAGGSSSTADGARSPGAPHRRRGSTIVGIAPTMRPAQSSRSRQPDPVVYIPLRAQAPAFAMLMIRTPATRPALTSLVREEVRAIDPDLPLFGIQTMDQQLAQAAMAVPRVRHDVRHLRA